MRKIDTILLSISIVLIILIVILNVKMILNNKEKNNNNQENNENNENYENSENNDQNNSQQQIITVAVLEGEYSIKPWELVAKAFEETYPGVTVELIIDKNIENIIIPNMKEGNVPDIIHLPIGRESALTETMIKERNILELTNVFTLEVPLEAVEVNEKMIVGVTDTLVTNPYGDGVTYFAPMFYKPFGLFYNAGLLKEKGWSIPRTWDEMWELGDKAKEEGIALFTYSSTESMKGFIFALLYTSGGPDFFSKCMTFEDGIWESEEVKNVFQMIQKLALYTEETTVANANTVHFTKNKQLLLDNKAIFCPNGIWLPSQMEEALKIEGFEWGFIAVPAVNKDANPASFCWMEQCFIPLKAKNPIMAKNFIAYMYSDEAASIFAKYDAIQPILGVSDFLEGNNKQLYQLFDQGESAVLGDFAQTQLIDTITISQALFDNVHHIMNGNLTVEQWQSSVEEVSDQYRQAMK